MYRSFWLTATGIAESRFSLGLGIVAAVRLESRLRILVSLQVIDPAGNTQIFIDGFESGDVS